MTFVNTVGPPPNHYDPAWMSRFWGWVTKIWFPFGRGSSGNLDHGSLDGLTDDDHTQYITGAPTAARGNLIDSGNDDIILLKLRRDSLTPHTQDVFEVINSALAVIAKITSTGKVYGYGLDAADQLVTNVLTPSATDDAANKGYVDSKVPQVLPSGTTKGDLLVFNGADWQILPVGTDGQFLTADSGSSVGVSWT